MYKNYTKLKLLEGFIGDLVTKLKKAAPRFERGIGLENYSYKLIFRGIDIVIFLPVSYLK